MTKLTKEQAIVIMGYTGITTCVFKLFHEDVENRLGRSIYTHEFAQEALWEEIKQVYRNDFVDMCYKEQE